MTNYSMTKTREGFTLVELIMAVSILSIGVVMVLRSFLSSSGALGLISDRTAALQILETKIADLKESALAGSLKPANTNEEIALNNRRAAYNLQVTSLKKKEEDEDFNEVRTTLNWREDNKEQDETIATYIKNNKVEQQEE
jgi:type II secretion system protein I